jgi:hypothetical protein
MLQHLPGVEKYDKSDYCEGTQFGSTVKHKHTVLYAVGFYQVATGIIIIIIILTYGHKPFCATGTSRASLNIGSRLLMNLSIPC